MAEISEDVKARVYRRNRHAAFTRFDQEGLLVLPKDAWQIVLNGVGLRTFELLDGVRTIGAIAGELYTGFDAPSADQVAADVAEFLEDLAGKGAVELVPRA